jgi:hypothetical protein
MVTAMISGHLDLKQAEFDAHYAPYLLSAMANGENIVVGDAPGSDQMAQTLIKKWTPWIGYIGRVTIYHMLTIPRHNAGFATKGGYASNAAKDAAMTADSDYDIAWVRPEKHSSVSGRVSGTEQNLIRRKAKG